MKERDEVDDLNVGFVGAVFLVGKLALVAFAGELVDVGLRFRIDPVIDEFATTSGVKMRPNGSKIRFRTEASRVFIVLYYRACKRWSIVNPEFQSTNASIGWFPGNRATESTVTHLLVDSPQFVEESQPLTCRHSLA